MRIVSLAVIALLLLPSPATAQRKRRQPACPAGMALTITGCRSLAAPTPATSGQYGSCPLDFVWSAASGRCTPVVRCPYDMAEVNGRCERPSRW